MAMKDAEKFIKEIVKNDGLRKSLYKFEDPEEKKKLIVKAGFDFEVYEIQESINYLKTVCAQEEDAIMLDELLLWWQMLMPFDQSCSPAECAGCSSCG